ncbi:cupin domain-containing protein [Lysobacter sp. FW306-1B-D06B]|uniref:cupin domain-containing protein n=1 Tax=Lysobacter sp. FW306-1B-D06B TaxID=3140250 RepID=UPI0031405DE5
MTTSRLLTAALLASLGALALPFASHAQGAGITRTDLQRHDLSVPGREAVQVLVGFAPGVVAANHHHPGEEIVYVVEGELEYRLEGRPPAVVKAGEVLFIPYGVNHEVRNVGKGKGAELATYIVEKGKPLVVPAASPKAAVGANPAAGPVEGKTRHVELTFADDAPLKPGMFDSPTAWEDEP